MSQRSRYDELHDEYEQILTTKRGTRYERLAAIVFAALDTSNVVIHDIKVIGDTGAEHQIDIQITQDGKPRHILVECKDFDISGDSVGLSIVRDFWGVADDIHPDEAWVVTCNDFTEEARKYAKGKGIKLATLRVFADADWQGRIRTIITNFTFRSVQVDKINLKVQTVHEGDEVRISQGLAANHVGGFVLDREDKTEFFDGATTRSLFEIVEQMTKRPSANEPGVTELVEGKLCDGWICLDGTNRYDIKGFSVHIPVAEVGIKMTIANNSAAKLILINDEGLDFILWDDQLTGYTIDDVGKVHIAPEAVQQRLITTFEPVPVPEPAPPSP